MVEEQLAVYMDRLGVDGVVVKPKGGGGVGLVQKLEALVQIVLKFEKNAVNNLIASPHAEGWNIQFFSHFNSISPFAKRIDMRIDFVANQRFMKLELSYKFEEKSPVKHLVI